MFNLSWYRRFIIKTIFDKHNQLKTGIGLITFKCNRLNYNYIEFLKFEMARMLCNFTKNPCHLNFFLKTFIFESEGPSSSSNYLSFKWYIHRVVIQLTYFCSNRGYTHIYTCIPLYTVTIPYVDHQTIEFHISIFMFKFSMIAVTL